MLQTDSPSEMDKYELAAIKHVKGKYHAKVIMAVLSADHRVDLEALDRATGDADCGELYGETALRRTPHLVPGCRCVVFTPQA